jgi:hypothetical protein
MRRNGAVHGIPCRVLLLHIVVEPIKQVLIEILGVFDIEQPTFLISKLPNPATFLSFMAIRIFVLIRPLSRASISVPLMLPSIEEHPACWQKLQQDVEIDDVGGQHREA